MADDTGGRKNIPRASQGKPQDESQRGSRMENVHRLQAEMGEQAARAAREGVGKLNEALNAAAVSTGLKLAKPVTDALEGAGDALSDLISGFYGDEGEE